MNNFYTYAYLREDGTPYYIGKGKENRVFSSNRAINKPKDKSRIIFLKQNLTEEEAFKHEIYMIAVFGRKDLGTGVLHNKTDGGEGASGAVRSEKTKQKMSNAAKGKIFTEEHRKNIGKSRKGRTHSKESKEKMSMSRQGRIPWNIGKKLTEEHRNKMSEAMKGKNNPFYGKKHKEEDRKKMSARHNKLLRFISPSGEIIEEISTPRKFCEKYNLDRGGMSKLIKGEQNQSKGWSMPLKELSINS